MCNQKYKAVIAAICVGMAVQRNVLQSVGLDGKNRVQRDGYFLAKTSADDMGLRCAKATYDWKVKS